MVKLSEVSTSSFKKPKSLLIVSSKTKPGLVSFFGLIIENMLKSFFIFYNIFDAFNCSFCNIFKIFSDFFNFCAYFFYSSFFFYLFIIG